jgi:two-component system response regulator PilR (NtrC family)
MQVKLLRAIQEKSIRPIGESRECPVNVRILSATHRDLGHEVSEGHFRQDLYFRLNVIEAAVPPLRDRPEDIDELVKHILGRLCNEWQLPVPSLTAAAREALADYPFPGNVRELENTLERALTLAEGSEIDVRHLQLRSGIDTPAPSGQPATAQRPPDVALEDYLQDIEKEEILRTLDATHWNRTAAAKKLGMTFRSLRYRLKKLEIDREE